MFLLLVVALLLGYLYHHYFIKLKQYPKGPTPLPLLGNLPIFTKNKQRLVELMSEWGRQYGGVFTVWLPLPFVMVTDYDLMKEHFVKQGDVFAGRPHLSILDHIGKGKAGILSADGALWKEHRRFALRVFREFGFGKNIMQEKIMIETRKLVDAINLEVENGQPFDPSHIIEISVGSVINSMIFGFAFEQNDPKFIRLKNLLDSVIQLSLDPQVLLLETMPLLRHFGFLLPKTVQVKEEFQKLLDFFAEEVEKHRQHLSVDEEATDYAGAFLKEQKDRVEKGGTEGTFTDHQLVWALSDLWAAGLETTVTTLRWAIAFLLHHPQVQQKVHQEIAEKIGLETEVTMDHRIQLPYTAATICELQRAANLLSITPGHAVTEPTMVQGCRVPTGTLVIPQISTVLHDERYFPQPEEFKPERFLDQNGALSIPEQFIPFSLGKRACLGESLAKMELFLIFTTMMQRFEFKQAEELPSMTPKAGFVRAPFPFEVTVLKRT